MFDEILEYERISKTYNIFKSDQFLLAVFLFTQQEEFNSSITRALPHQYSQWTRAVLIPLHFSFFINNVFHHTDVGTRLLAD